MGTDLGRAARDAAARVANRPSALVQQEVLGIKRILQPAASRDATGPAATVIRRIDGRLRDALPDIRRLEGQLQSQVLKDRTQVATQLSATIDHLLSDVPVAAYLYRVVMVA